MCSQSYPWVEVVLPYGLEIVCHAGEAWQQNTRWLSHCTAARKQRVGRKGNFQDTNLLIVYLSSGKWETEAGAPGEEQSDRRAERQDQWTHWAESEVPIRPGFRAVCPVEYMFVESTIVITVLCICFVWVEHTRYTIPLSFNLFTCPCLQPFLFLPIVWIASLLLQ